MSLFMNVTFKICKHIYLNSKPSYKRIFEYPSNVSMTKNYAAKVEEVLSLTSTHHFPEEIPKMLKLNSIYHSQKCSTTSRYSYMESSYH